MKTRLLIIMTFASIELLAQDVTPNFVTDTIDYEDKRMYIEVPEISRKLSSVIADDEGFWICFPFLGDSGINGILVIDYSVMNRNHLKYTQDYDVELWNTINRNSVGSRCFIKNGLFYRIDSYEDGLQIFYTDATASMVELLNSSMQSIYKKVRINTDPPVTINRKISKNEIFKGQ